jgi:hypothetical protein
LLLLIEEENLLGRCSLQEIIQDYLKSFETFVILSFWQSVLSIALLEMTDSFYKSIWNFALLCQIKSDCFCKLNAYK